MVRTSGPAADDLGDGPPATADERRRLLARRHGRSRLPWSLLAALVLLAPIACAPPAGPGPVRFARVDLPGGAVPQVLAAAGDDLLVGVRHGGPEPRPGIVRIGPDGASTALTVTPTSGYGATASWYSLDHDGRQVVGIGGDRGGAHGNVRWSVWTGSGTAVQEQEQAFSTFGGWGAGGLVDSVLTAGGPVVVGSWQSADAGLDVALWSADGATWVRRDSTGTPLASTRGALGFPLDVAALQQGLLVVGWQLAAGTGGSAPVAWRSASGQEPWTRTPLPDAGTSGAATAVRCVESTCAVSGRVDGVLALWRLTGDRWSRVADVPPVPVGARGPLPAPLNPAGPLVQVVPDGARITILRLDEAGSTQRPAEGPTGTAVSAVEAGGSLYLLAGANQEELELWRADASALRLPT
ncbi:hypothetical protein ACU61A_36325 [Pseudonocardia sichuanensis]